MRGHRLLLICAVTCGLWSAAPATADGAEPSSLAVLGIESQEVPESLAQQVTDALRQRASATSGLRVVPGKDLMEMKMVFACDSEAPACMAQAGKSLGADKLLFGSVKKAPGGKNAPVLVALRLLDVRTATIERQVNETVQRRDLAGGGINTQATKWFEQLLEIESKPTLTVLSEPTNASVSVDAQAMGRTPVTLRDLTAGTHTVTISMPGRAPATRSVDLRPGGSHDIVVTLEPEAGAVPAPPPVTHDINARAPEPTPLTTVPPTPPTLPAHPGRGAKIAALALGVAAVATAGVAIWTWRTYINLEDTAHQDLLALQPQATTAAQNDFLANPGCNPPASFNNSAEAKKFHDDCSKGAAYADATTALWVVAGALATGGVISYIVGDRQAAHAREKATTSLGVIRQSLRIAPVVTSRSGAVTAAFEF